MCTYVYMYIRAHIHHICIGLYAHVRTYMRTHTGYMYVYMRVRTCVHIHKLVYTKLTHGRGYHTSCYKAAHVRGQDRTAGGTWVLDPTG